MYGFHVLGVKYFSIFSRYTLWANAIPMYNVKFRLLFSGTLRSKQASQLKSIFFLGTLISVWQFKVGGVRGIILIVDISGCPRILLVR